MWWSSTRERHVLRQALVLRQQSGVPGDPPQRLLELGHGEHHPAIDLGARLEIGWQELALRVLLREVEHDRGRFRDHQIAVDQHRKLARRIESEEFRPLMLAREQVHDFELELGAEFVEAPQGAQGSRRTEAIEFHRLPPLCRSSHDAWARPKDSPDWRFFG
jgi:hypothetical protein